MNTVWNEKKKYRVGMISDTHGNLSEEVIDILQECNLITHCGDYNIPCIYDELTQIAPVLGVRGNCDYGMWTDELEDELYFEIGGIRFYMVHDRECAPYDLENVDIALHGHTHVISAEKEGNLIWLNPGSCGQPRYGLSPTMLVMEIEDGQYTIEKYSF